jgi:carbonic anhydrase/acetyltransferase-like protein (isoleucine patch superfamily)
MALGMIESFGARQPRVHPQAFVVDTAVVLGDVELGAEASVWFHAVVRGDMEPIRIGAQSNVQDNAVLHVVGGKYGTYVGDRVTIGHGAVVHGCTVGHDCLIGMGAIVLDGAEIGDESLVGAGALVTPGTKIPPRSLVLGSPAKRIREVTGEEIERIRRSGRNYLDLVAEYRRLGVGRRA